jgi:hypothetical protein
MSTDGTTTTAPSGSYDLLVPTGMFNLMVPEDRTAAERSFRDLFREMFPSATDEELEALADGLLRWREALLERGVVFHGVVAAPAGFEHEGHVYGAAHWHVVAGVTAVPDGDGNLDTGAVAARVLAEEYDPSLTYSESFETRMGWGAGVITELPVTGLTPPTGLAPTTGAIPTRLALALGMAGRPGDSHALFVAGIAFDVAQKHEMASVGALMTGQSSIETDAAVNGSPG